GMPEAVEAEIGPAIRVVRLEAAHAISDGVVVRTGRAIGVVAGFIIIIVGIIAISAEAEADADAAAVMVPVPPIPIVIVVVAARKLLAIDAGIRHPERFARLDAATGRIALDHRTAAAHAAAFMAILRRCG